MRYHKIIKELMDMPENARNAAVESIGRTIESAKQKLETNKSLCPKIGHSISKWHKMEGEMVSLPSGMEHAQNVEKLKLLEKIQME